MIRQASSLVFSTGLRRKKAYKISEGSSWVAVQAGPTSQVSYRKKLHPDSGTVGINLASLRAKFGPFA